MSSKRRIRRRACETKVRHLTHAAAMKHLRSLRSPDPLNVYRCAFCKGFHVGHKPFANKPAPGRHK